LGSAIGNGSVDRHDTRINTVISVGIWLTERSEENHRGHEVSGNPSAKLDGDTDTGSRAERLANFGRGALVLFERDEVVMTLRRLKSRSHGNRRARHQCCRRGDSGR
jgi:hypothetical protein